MSPCFRGLPEDWVRQLSEAASARSFAPGEVLETEAGAPCLYMLAVGEVRVLTRPDPGEVSEVVGHETPGAVFGSGSITGEEEVPVYTASRPVEVYAWRPHDLRRLFAGNDALRRQLETRLSSRARRAELVDLVRRTPLFRQASQSLVRWLVDSATLGWFETGSVLFREGDEADEMFVIVSGDVALFHQVGGAEAMPSGRLRQLHRGDYLGEIALIQRSLRTASAVAISDSEVLTIDRQAFDVLCQRSSRFRQAVQVSAQVRRQSTISAPVEPELVWLVNDSPLPTEQLAVLVADSLRGIVGEVAGPRPLRGARGAEAALRAGRNEHAAYVLCFSEKTEARRVGRRVADRASGIVYISADAAERFPWESTSLHRVLNVAVGVPDGAVGREAVRRDTFMVPLPSDVRGVSIDGLPANARGGLHRLARAICHRRVAVALGGGAAWGYAHVALLRGLERVGIPIDMIFGVSMGSVVGAFYASQGLRGLDRLVDARLEFAAAALVGVGTSSSVDLFVRRHIRERRLEDLSIPLATVAVDAPTGQERVFRQGSVSTAVRASCSLPGVFGRPVPAGPRYLDGCVRNNVPVSHCIEADADFVIACDVVPSVRATRDLPRRGVRGLALDLLQISRLTDTVRSLYWLAGETGRRHAQSADVLFSPELSGFNPWDFHRAPAIVQQAEEQLDEWLPAAQARHRALSLTWRVDG